MVLLKNNPKKSNRRSLFYLILTLFAYLNCSSIALTAQYQPPPTFSKDQYQFEPFLLPGGKIENIIQCMAQDSSGFLWFGTQNGLVKYDGRQYHRYFHNPLDSNSLISSYVECIYVDTDGSLWIGAFDQGFTRFDPTTNLFQRYYLQEEDGKKQSKIGVNAIIRHRDYIWLGTHNGLRRFDSKKGILKTYFFNPNSKDIFTSNVFRALYVDQEDVLWAGKGFSWSSDKTNGGLYKYQPKKGSFTIFKHDSNNNNSLSDNRVKGVFEDSNHNFWIGTMGDGLNLMDRTTNSFVSFPYPSNQPNQLSRPWIADGDNMDNLFEQVQFIHEDVDQKLWIGAFDSGLNIYDSASNKQIHFSNGMNGLETRNIWNIFETKDKAIFICSGGDGEGKNYRVKIKQHLFDFVSITSDSNIEEIIGDQDQQIWLGGSEDVWHFNPRDSIIVTTSLDFKEKMLRTELSTPGQQLSNLVPSLIRPFGIPAAGEKLNPTKSIFGKPFNELFIKAVKKDKSGNIWVGTWGDGLFHFNTKTQAIKSFKYAAGEKWGIGGNHVTVIFEDRKGKIWVGGGKEAKNLHAPFFLDRLDTNVDTFTHYYLPDTEYGYPPNISEDKTGNLWYPTVLGGVHQLNTSTGDITKYNQTNSRIPSDNIRTLVITPDDNIWMSTEKTLIRWTADRQSFIEYGATEGIKIDEFLHGSSYISPDNTIYFGGAGGFHFFDPTKLSQKEKLATVKILLTEVAINKPISNEETELLIKSIPLNKDLNLTHDENTFSIGFTLLDYQAPQKVYLEYQLEGQDSHWKVAENNKTAQYYNLPPDNYLFKVRGANSRGLWNTKAQQLKITIHPPWYQTNWAYLLFFGLLSGLLYSGYKFQLTRQLALKEAEKLAALDEAKTQLYTNITHEFRTPLTLILGFAQNTRTNLASFSPAVVKKNLQYIERNGQQLLNLINQMLSLSKLKNGELKLNNELGDVVFFIKYLSESFQSYAETEGIQLVYYSEEKTLEMDYDREKLQLIIANLLSNAIKFTSKAGKIILHLSIFPAKLKGANPQFQIKIVDSGMGIPTEQLAQIFNRFYQVDGRSTRSRGGSGIGLALTKELVELMQGTISVTSEVDTGTTFRVLLPINKQAKRNPVFQEVDHLIPLPSDLLEKKMPVDGNWNTSAQQEKPLLLLIEDNTDIAVYIRSLLEKDYNLYWAVNGQLGIDKALELIPDIIISDVMMPEKDGFEVTKTLKNDERTSHIPIILLTAKADIASKIRGLERGADAYLAKPFQPKELQIRLKKMIALRRNLQGYYANEKAFTVPKKQETTAPELVAKNIPTEDAFLLKINAILDKHLSDANLDIPFICQKLHTSQSQLYRKIKALTNKSIVAYLRTYRLHKAKILLQNSNRSVSDIAYEVGFSNPSYFSRLFSEEYGIPPSNARK